MLFQSKGQAFLSQTQRYEYCFRTKVKHFFTYALCDCLINRFSISCSVRRTFNPQSIDHRKNKRLLEQPALGALTCVWTLLIDRRFDSNDVSVQCKSRGRINKKETPKNINIQLS